MVAFGEQGGKIYIENLVYQNSIQTGARWLIFSKINELDVKNVTFQNVHSYGNNPWLAVSNYEYDTSIDGFYMYNSSVNMFPAIFVDDEAQVVIIKNWRFENLLVESENSLIRIFSGTSIQLESKNNLFIDYWNNLNFDIL